jgi:hypothetical protein
VESLPAQGQNGAIVVSALITIAAILAGLVFVAIANRWWAGKQRRSYLRAEYGDDPVLTQRLIAREIWAGMTERQLVDAQGDPSAKDQRQQDGRSIETFKYDRRSENFRLLVHLENGVVRSWEKEQ